MNIELAEEPITISKYLPVPTQHLPQAIFGFQIKSKFDEERFTFKPEYKAERFSHYCYTDVLEPLFFYGIKIQVKEQYKRLLSSLSVFSTNLFYCKTVEEYVGKYKALLNKYGLECETCYRYLCDGLFPIDLKYLNEFMAPHKPEFSHENLQNMLEPVSKDAWYLNLGPFGIYILAENNIRE